VSTSDPGTGSEIIELKDVQIGNIDKLKCRLIITKLTAEGKGAKEKKQKKTWRKRKL
jgi:hypothetical protein